MMRRMHEILELPFSSIEKSKSKSDLLISNNVHVGVELELYAIDEESIRVDEDGDEYYSKHFRPETSFINSCGDGSLGEYGTELRFSKPLNGLDIIHGLNDLDDIIKSNSDMLYATQLGGIHVHIDICNMGLKQFKRFVYIYMLFDKVFERLIGKGRDSNPFCTSANKSLAMRKVLSGVIDSDSMRDLSTPRYSTINFQALYKFGSLEFRGMETTFDINGRLLDWINILLSVRKASSRLKYKIDNLIKLESTDYDSIIDDVFSPELIRKYFSYDTLHDDLEVGVTFLQDSYYFESMTDATNRVIRTLSSTINNIADEVDDEVSEDSVRILRPRLQIRTTDEQDSVSVDWETY